MSFFDEVYNDRKKKYLQVQVNVRFLNVAILLISKSIAPAELVFNVAIIQYKDFCL
jgi:hypothetical protein